MPDLLGALLISCSHCGSCNVLLKWVAGFGWTCPNCGNGLHGSDQKPTVGMVEPEDTDQMDMFA